MIFLDEPISGLDSEMACQVMDSLVSLARRDRLVRSSPAATSRFHSNAMVAVCRFWSLLPIKASQRSPLSERGHHDAARLQHPYVMWE